MEPMGGVPPTREYDDTRLKVVGVVADVLSQLMPLKVAALAVAFICCWIWVTSAWILLRSIPAVLASTSRDWSLVRPESLSPITGVKTVYSVSTVAADRPSRAGPADCGSLSARIEVAIEQWAALSDAVETRWPVEMRVCVVES